MNETREEFKNIANTGEQVAGAIADFLTALLRRQGYIEDFDAYAIVNHVSNGGSTIQTSVSVERVNMMSELLKKHHVSYLCVNNTDPLTREQNYVFIMKDTKSVRNSFGEIQKEFQILLDIEKKELTPQSFASLFKGEKIGVMDNLTPEEILAFREVSKDYEFLFTVVTGEKRGTHCIYCSNPKMLKEAMMDVSYHFTQEKGQEYEAALQNYVVSTNSFTKRAGSVPKDEVLYLVDAKDLRHFISITNKEFTSHSVNLETERLPGGRSREILADTMYKSYNISNTEQLLVMAKAMRTPVFLSQQEFGLVSGIAKSGEAILVKDYAERFKPLQESLKKSKSVLAKQPVYKNALDYQPMEGYVGLPKETIRILEQMELKDVLIIENDIAFPKAKKQEIDTILEALLYQNLSPLERKEAELFYSGAGDLVVSKEPAEAQYILNPDHPDYVIKNSEKGLTVFIDGKQDMFIARETPDFPTTALAILKQIEHPVILSEGEMYSENKQTYIEYRAYDNIPNEAMTALRFQEDLEKQELHMENPLKYENLTEKQQEALKRNEKYQMYEMTMDGKEEKDLMNKQMEKLLNRQKQQEMNQSPDM